MEAPVLGGIATPWRHKNSKLRKTLPLRPIWTGFAVNTLFYAALLWLPVVLRRWIRVKRGQGPKCRYPIGQSAVCTECGKALPNRVGAGPHCCNLRSEPLTSPPACGDNGIVEVPDKGGGKSGFARRIARPGA